VVTEARNLDPDHGGSLKFIHCFIQGDLTTGGRLSTVDPLLLTSSDQLLFSLKIVFTFFAKSYFNEEVNCTESSPSVSVLRCHLSN
jgi:hypothetical protein